MKKIILSVFGLGLAVVLLSACGGSSSTPVVEAKSDLETFQAAGAVYSAEQIEEVINEGTLGTDVSNALIPLAFDNSGTLVKPTEPTQEQVEPPFKAYFLSKETYDIGKKALETEISSYDFIQLDSSTPAIVPEVDDSIETDSVNSATYIDVYGLEASSSDVAEISADRFWIRRLGEGEPTKVCASAYWTGRQWACNELSLRGWGITSNKICKAHYGSNAYASWWNWWSKKPFCKENKWG